MTQQSESLTDEIERLIIEGRANIPAITTGRGTFNTSKWSPTDWLGAFVEVLPKTPGAAFHPDKGEIYSLVTLLNDLTLGTPTPPFVAAHATLTTTLSYVMFEMLIRRLTPALDEWGYLTQPVSGLLLNQPVSGLIKVLNAFEETTVYIDLKSDLSGLNAQMTSKEYTRSGSAETRDLYGRLVKGRNLMLHGNLSHSFEGLLLVLLIDFIILHVARQDMRGAGPIGRGDAREESTDV